MDIPGLSPDLVNPILADRKQSVLPSDLSRIESAPDFQKLLKQAVDKVNNLQQSASSQMHSIDAGESKDLLGTMISVQKAGISFQALVQVRNKAVSAYEEIMRMQI
ncbi:MAG: flagellar hook-basal body complex protein FliE [Endozoicomonas sp.]